MATSTYEFVMEVKSAHISGGGLPHDSYVEIFVNDKKYDNTEILPPPPTWNKTFTYAFPSMDAASSVPISFAVYKKRWTSQGYKLVGTLTFQLSDYYGSVNKEPIEKSFELKQNKRNVSLSGSILLKLEMKEIKPVVVEQIAVSEPQESKVIEAPVVNINDNKVYFIAFLVIIIAFVFINSQRQFNISSRFTAAETVVDEIQTKLKSLL